MSKNLECSLNAAAVLQVSRNIAWRLHIPAWFGNWYGFIPLL
jgi:hypothetical protein